MSSSRKGIFVKVFPNRKLNLKMLMIYFIIIIKNFALK